MPKRKFKHGDNVRVLDKNSLPSYFRELIGREGKVRSWSKLDGEYAVMIDGKISGLFPTELEKVE